MSHVSFRNVNDAFSGLVRALHTNQLETIRTSSRAGDVIQVIDPVIVTYRNPCERVLFNTARDCNPWFHLFESMWMLAGCNDVARMKFYSSNIADIASDDGVTFNGAYGFRWRHYNADLGDSYDEIDQLELIVNHLRNKPDSRRTVLQMWSPTADLLKVEKTKDVCCNTQAYFAIQDGKLNMTVCNRSNDMIWGMLGANVVHFSILQEYLAAAIGVPVGAYNQFTNNLHVYTDRWEPEKWLAYYEPDPYWSSDNPVYLPLVLDPVRFLDEVQGFAELTIGDPEPAQGGYQEPFIRKVALPMAMAFLAYKNEDFTIAMRFAERIGAMDWRIACTHWLDVRRQRRERKQQETTNGVDRT